MKFMESFLANRPKVGSESSGVPGLGAEGMDASSYSGLLGGEDLGGFGEEMPRSGGFQSLRTALLEAGSVVASRPVDGGAGVVGGAMSGVAGPTGANGGAGDAASGGDSDHAHGQDPTVELITKEGRIEKVVVTCSCGRRIELDCAY